MARVLDDACVTPVKRSEGGFVAVVGSHARGDHDERSDFDVLVVGDGGKKAIDALRAEAGARFSLIPFSVADFYRLHASGSLFLKHCFSEGRLVFGSEAEWGILCDTFRVRDDFTSEVYRCAHACRYLESPEIFDGRFLPAYVFAFPQVKNAAIFFLATHGLFQFNKKKAILDASDIIGFGAPETLLALKEAYDYSVGDSTNRTHHWHRALDQGEVMLQSVIQFVGGLASACNQ